MDNMRLNNHHSTVYELIAQGEQLLESMEFSQLAQELRQESQKMQQKTVPTIMFYGLYNAGKSTLINALCGKEVAKVGDVPTTAAIQSVSWNSYHLVDTPGINAKDEHTRIAIEEIDRSDLILFVVDNADGFEREIVAQAVTEVLQRQRPIAVVINQKNIDADEEPSIPVPQLSSMTRIVAKVSENLRRYTLQNGFDILDEKKNFLGVFPVNAQLAFEASLCADKSDEMLLYENSGISSLVNAIDNVIRASAPVRMLLTPALLLKEKLKAALTLYQASVPVGKQQECAAERNRLSESRQRTSDRLMTEGLRKIEASFEQIRTLAAAGKPVDQIPRQLQADLTALVRDVTQREIQLMQVDLQMPDISADQTCEESSASDRSSLEGGLLADTLSGVMPPVPLPTRIPIDLVEIVIGVVGAFVGWLSSRDRQELEAEQQARKNAERLAAFYKWQNELRDQETQIKANYIASVEQVLKQIFDEPIEQLSQKLAQINDACAQYAVIVKKVEDLIVRISEEISELSLTL